MRTRRPSHELIFRNALAGRLVAETQHDAVLTRSPGRGSWRAIEFFAGIGGFAWAWPECDIAVAIDIDAVARDVYQRHWPHRYMLKEIAALNADMLTAFEADLWWLSPPCQPYSRRGHQRDLDDPRAAALLHLISLIPQLRPRALALENVLGFGQSRSWSELESVLVTCGYHVATCTLCPTQLGWPNRRPRFYMLACHDRLMPWRDLPHYATTLDELLSGDMRNLCQPAEENTLAMQNEDACCISDRERSLFGSAMDRVDAGDSQAVTACFGSSYGKSLLHAGSYLVKGEQWRRFTPREVACLLGFPAEFTMPTQLDYQRAWKLLGNSLSIPVVRFVLSHLPPAPPR